MSGAAVPDPVGSATSLRDVLDEAEGARPGGAGPASREATRPARGYAVVTGAAYGMLLVLGFLLGVLGSFEYSWCDVAAGGVRIPLGAILIAVGVAVACRLAGWGMRSRTGAAVPAVGWLVATYLLSVQRGEGDLVVTGTPAGYLYLFGGLILVTTAVVLTPLARPGTPASRPPRPGRGGRT